MRAQDWPSRLDAVIKKYQAIPFECGSADCGAFTDACLSAMLCKASVLFPDGKNYNDEAGIKELTTSHGGIIKWVSCTLKKKPVKPLLAQRGDVVILAGALGIMMAEFAWFMTASGLKAVPRAKTRLAWRVD